MPALVAAMGRIVDRTRRKPRIALCVTSAECLVLIELTPDLLGDRMMNLAARNDPRSVSSRGR
jgi:hypothetical protein